MVRRSGRKVRICILEDHDAAAFSGGVSILSTSCKTVLNVMYYPDKVFCLKGCGEEAVEMLFAFEKGAVYSDYAMIPFDFDKVEVCSDGKMEVIDDYEELKAWWQES